MVVNIKVVKALDGVIQNLATLKEELSVTATTEEAPKEVTESADINIELLAKKVAYAYSTFHPEYSVDSQFKNLKDMIEGNKLSIVTSWLRAKDITGIKSFFTKDINEKRSLLIEAISKYEPQIKEVLTKRFKS